MKWEKDKIDHYNFCYSFVSKWPVPLVGFFLVLIIGAAKELVWDLLLGKGHPEWDDFKANWLGAVDALLGRKNKFK